MKYKLIIPIMLLSVIGFITYMYCFDEIIHSE